MPPVDSMKYPIANLRAIITQVENLFESNLPFDSPYDLHLLQNPGMMPFMPPRPPSLD
jgi:hypothetical protein